MRLCGNAVRIPMETAPVRPRRPPLKPITRELWSLAAPIIGLNVLNVLSLAVDTALCGRLPNQDVVLAALGYSVQLLFLLQVAMFGLTIGSVAMVARAHGARDRARVDLVLGQSITLTVLVSVGVAVLGNLFASPIVHALGADDAVTAEALRFLRPLLTGTVFSYLILLFAALLRGVGNTRLPFQVALLQNALNALFNSVLIYGALGIPALGVAGAAWGTLASQAIGVIVLVSRLKAGAVPGIALPRRLPPIVRAEVAALWRVGAPAALDMVILNASFISLIAMLGYIDDAAVAAHGIGLRIQALAFVPGMSIAQATGALVGQSLGAGNPERAREVFRASVRLCVGVMGSLSFIILVLAPWLVQVFDVHPDSRVGAHAVMWMRILGFGMPIVSVWIATSGLLQGAGDTQTSLRINVIATIFVQIPLSWLLGFPLGLGAAGVWLGMPLAAIARTWQGIAAYRQNRWVTKGKR